MKTASWLHFTWTRQKLIYLICLCEFRSFRRTYKSKWIYFIFIWSLSWQKNNTFVAPIQIAGLLLFSSIDIFWTKFVYIRFFSTCRHFSLIFVILQSGCSKCNCNLTEFTICTKKKYARIFRYWTNASNFSSRTIHDDDDDNDHERYINREKSWAGRMEMQAIACTHKNI